MFSERFAQARSVGMDAIAEETLEMADALPERAYGKVDNGHVAWMRNRVWTRLRILAIGTLRVPFPSSLDDHVRRVAREV